MFYYAKWLGPETRKREREKGYRQRRRDPMNEWKEKTESKGTIERETSKPDLMTTQAEERTKKCPKETAKKKPEPSTDG